LSALIKVLFIITNTVETMWNATFKLAFNVHYLRQRGYVFVCLSVCLFVCLCVSKITQKVMDRFFRNFEEMSSMA